MRLHDLHPFLYGFEGKDRGQSAAKEWPVCITSYTLFDPKSQVAVPLIEKATFDVVRCICCVIIVLGIMYYSRV